MSWIKDLTYGAMKCGQGDPTGEKFEENKGTHGCKNAGDVTIPAGATLTLKKGAKVVDEDGVLGSGGGSTPVVILPETVLTAEAGFAIMTPLEAEPVTGLYSVVWNGTAYDCEAFAVPGGMGMPAGTVAMGNADILSQGIGASGGNPDAPFVLMLWPNSGADEMGAYGALNPVDDTDTATISIVLKEAKASDAGNAAGSGIFMLHAVAGEKEGSVYACTVDKTYAETAEALASGAYAVCQVSVEGINTWLPIVSREASGAFAFSVTISSITYIFSLGEDDSASLMVLT